MLGRLFAQRRAQLHALNCSLQARWASSSRARGPYAQLTEADLGVFRDILGPEGLVEDAGELQASNRDWMGRYEGQSRLALRPATTQQAAAVLSHCNERRLAVVPQGGNSGLCGGSVPVFDEVILRADRMDQILAFDEVSGALTCQAGCTLGGLNAHIGPRGFVVPLDLGAKHCQAGGFVSTNAGGLRLVRFGSLRGTVLGLEAVTADGTVLDLLQPLRKNNTGYDLKQLFIGGEGSLGFVTTVSILCPPKPASVQLCYLACDSYAAVQQVLVRARQRLGEILSACEFLDRQALQLTLQVLPDRVADPLPGAAPAPFYMLVETSGSEAAHDAAKLRAFLDSCHADGLVAGGTIADSPEQQASIWRMREHISVALSTKGPVFKYDLSLPVADIYSMVEATRERLAGHPEAAVVAYGHLGDGNVHLNVSVPRLTEAVAGRLEPWVYQRTAAMRGSISAEHGLGQLKNDYLGLSKPPAAVAAMAQLKRLFDPNLILNPHKFLPASFWEEQLGTQRQQR